MANQELGRRTRIAINIDKVYTRVTLRTPNRYGADKKKEGAGEAEPKVVVHRRRGGQKAGFWHYSGVAILGHERDVVHVIEDGQVVSRFKLGQVERDAKEIIQEEEVLVPFTDLRRGVVGNLPSSPLHSSPVDKIVLGS